MKFLNDRKAASVELGKRILTYIEIDMTPKEVEYILGKPDRGAGTRRFYYDRYGLDFISPMGKSQFLLLISYINHLGQRVCLKEHDYNILIDGIKESDKYCSSEINEYVLGK